MQHGRISCKANPKPGFSLVFNSSSQCHTCGQSLKIPGYLHTAGMLFGFLCLIFGIAFSIKYRSLVPYVPAVALVAVSQWWLGWRAPRKVAS
jgi:hypothetical protein